MSRTASVAPLSLIVIILIVLMFGIYLSVSLTTTTPLTTSQTGSSGTGIATIFSTPLRSSSSTLTTSTITSEFQVATGTSIPNWEFIVRIVAKSANLITISSNLTYTGSQPGATYELGSPIAVAQAHNQTGSTVWSTVATALLRRVNVTYGELFTYSENVTSGKLQAGGNYTFEVRPQLNAANGQYLGNQLALSFVVLIPVETS